MQMLWPGTYPNEAGVTALYISVKPVKQTDTLTTWTAKLVSDVDAGYSSKYPEYGHTQMVGYVDAGKTTFNQVLTTDLAITDRWC
jgi:hypothetical protein